MLAVTVRAGGVIVLWLAIGFVALAGLVLLWTRRRRPRTPPGLPAHLTRIYTTHAKDRMQQRGISREDVEEVLARPERVTHDEVENSMRFEKDVRSMVVRVWVAADPWPPTDKVVVKTTAARHFASLTVPRRAIGSVIGRGGSTIRQVQSATNAKIRVEENGKIYIHADEQAQVVRALRMVTEIAKGEITRR